MPTLNKSTLLLIGAFAAIYIIWGSTFLFAAFAMDQLPPFFMAGTRYFIAGALLLLLTFSIGKYQPVTWLQFKNALFAGILMLGIGGGLVFWGLQYLDSGFTALVISGQPLLIVFMMWGLQGKRPSKQAYVGILLGMLGIYLLVTQKTIVTNPNQWTGILFVFASMLSWAYGSLFVGKEDMPKPQMTNSALQMLIGGTLLVIGSFLFESPQNIEWSQINSTTYGAMVYLIIFGSIIAFSSFNFLLSKVSPEKVATSTYVNPIVALFLGWMFRAEVITTQSMLAAGIMLTGVFFINTKPEYSKKLLRRLKMARK